MPCFRILPAAPVGASALFLSIVLLSIVQTSVAAPVAELTVVRPVVAGQSVSASLKASGVSNSPVYGIVYGPTQGMVHLDTATGAFTYVANINASGRDSLTFQASDDNDTSGLQDVHLTVHPRGLRVVGVGDDANGQIGVGGWGDIVAVAAGIRHTLGVRHKASARARVRR